MGSLQSGLRRAPVLGLALALLLVVAPACLASTGAAANVTTPTACNDPLCVLEYGCNSGVPCKTCVTPYRLVDGVCKRCPQPECIACNTAGKCTYCIGDGDYPPTPLYSLVNGTCKAPLASKCGIGCVVCNVPPGGGKPVCSKCGNGLRVVDGQCQPVNGYNAYCIYRGEKCVGCGDAYEFRKGSCVASSPNCDIASHKYPSKCEICKKGYGAKLGYDRTTHTVLGGCVRCPSNCESCGIATTCDLCRDGFKNVNGKCEACPRFCASCSGSSPCTWCMWGYGLNKQGACVPCKDRNCGDCTYSLNSCDDRSCKEGFASVYGECVPCESPRCRYCELGPSRCRMCYPGWGGDAIGGCNVRCAKSTGEPNCTRCDISPTICEACRDGYLLYFDALGRRRCQACKVKNCKSCAFPGKCSECLEGSTLRQDGTCAPGLG